MKANKQPLGVFDSGVGGLTVFKEIRRRFPNEDIIYFGDTARVPYGPKSKNTVIEYSIQNSRFLMQQNVKLIVIACNTSSAVALNVLQDNFSVPILSVIEPGAIAASKITKNGRIGVIGTEGTIRSQAYTKAIKLIDSKLEVFSKPCPLFVSLAEEGWANHPITLKIVEEYLNGFEKEKIDTLVLGCTHYPILKEAIRQVVGDQVALVDSSIAILADMEDYLAESTETETGKDLFFVSDNEDKFKAIAEDILNITDFSLSKVKLGESWYIDHILKG